VKELSVNRFSIVVLSVLAVACFSSSPALAAQATSDVMAPIQTFLAVTNGQSNVDLDTLFTEDAVVVDENAPYLFSGPHAASQWFAELKTEFAKNQMTGFNAAAGPAIEYSQTGDLAYLILPMTLTGTAGTKPFRETGTLTFTFRRTAGDWKISSDVWTTSPQPH
jgi:ketosteroid isomerase-like protein